MSDDCCSPEPASRITRRHLIVGGAVTGTALALGAVPALGQDEGTTGGSDITPDTGSTTTTTTTAPSTTTTTTPAIPDTSGEGLLEPAHGDLRAPTTNRAFGTLLSDSPDRGIMFPVLPNSAASWSDTYGACRSGCSRRHQGQDLMAPKMTKLLAVKSGTIVELRHRSSGNSLYIRGDDGWFYCYLHINNDRPGTDDASNRVEDAWGPNLRRFATGTSSMNETAARGHRVQQGEVVAYCGDSGNAEGTGPHLHFEIRQPASGSFSSETSRLWSSASVNPRVSLQNAIPAREGGVDPAVYYPWTTSADFIGRQYTDLLQRTAAAANLAHWGGLLDSGQRTPESMMAYFLESDECDDKAQSVARLYRAFFRRDPDYAGFRYWMDNVKRGMTLNKVAENFVRVPEFVSMYGSLTDSEFVDLVYQNVLGRNADAGGKAFWLSEIDRGVSRGRVMSHFSQSPEFRTAQDAAIHVLTAYALMYKRMPTAQERSAWIGVVRSVSATTPERTKAMLNMLRMTEEYRGVVRR